MDLVELRKISNVLQTHLEEILQNKIECCESILNLLHIHALHTSDASNVYDFK